VGKRAKLEKPKLAESKFVIGLSATTLLLFFGWTVYMRYYFQFPSTLDDPLVPPYFKRAEDAKPFPRTLDPSQFLPGEVREAYSIAEEMPDVLAQQPTSTTTRSSRKLPMRNINRLGVGRGSDSTGDMTADS
jgi:hypothetical protein